MIELKRIGILLGKPNHEQMVSTIQEKFETHHIQTVLLNWDHIEELPLDLIITIGGDGTVLYALGKYPSCPVIAINDGRVGFLTTGNKEDLEGILNAILEGKYIISERSMLECQYPNGTVYSVNEVVIKGVTKLISVDLFVNDLQVRRIRGDGVIVGTSTGSTAYLLSAGSPIVMPEVRCILLSGLNEYHVTARHLVLNYNVRIRLLITPDTHEQEIYLSADGREKISLAKGDEILIKEAEYRARLIFLDQNYFFNNLSSRLSW